MGRSRRTNGYENGLQIQREFWNDVFPPPNDEDQASFGGFLDPDANERPRLSLSCHGDKSDAYESVFIEEQRKNKNLALLRILII